ncbi:hypothetical protein KMW28_10590 [Flammeovirga yaeyamensis]|uniref:Restriction endonuclease n=1 Tax=Flammeovirga yaeyamensis TaxID=367791 RepID=A0AAX1MXP9_9BACT|nr:hypothetical protein [Flammeovirga yaeyamensis]MBB3696397.1 hypothetical protein [Flammeovirga yaeyamensis]NMF35076.1 hypothetical protein [Flammeovirga yaeyamensis]QWG00103.1 hypothetical protein KMW28_10590 [Flammeovirga yaeyamensis]
MNLYQLEQIELEFEILIQKDRRNWLRVAKLLDKIEVNQLYKLRSRSFTEYVKELARKNGINISTLWRARSGAKLYAELLGVHDVDKMDEAKVKTTPEQLETFSKVRTIAPQRIVDEVKDKMISGENMRHELRELWNIYRPLKGGKTERGRKRSEETPIAADKSKSQFVVPYDLKDSSKNEHVKANSLDKYWEDLKKMEKYQVSSENVARANIINALRSEQWLARTFKEDFTFKHEHLISFRLGAYTEIDILSVCKPNKMTKERPQFIGVEVVTNLEDFAKSKSKIITKAQYCDYFYFAVPLNQQYIDHMKEFCEGKPYGIICVSDELNDENKHDWKILKSTENLQISPQNEYIIMQKCIERILGW